jgi:hypothetical protein
MIWGMKSLSGYAMAVTTAMLSRFRCELLNVMVLVLTEALLMAMPAIIPPKKADHLLGTALCQRDRQHERRLFESL